MATPTAQERIERRAARYGHASLRKQFALQVTNPPVMDNHNGVLIRRTGASVYYPFWHGYDGVGKRGVPTSAYDVAYMAGKFRRELEDKGLLPIIPAFKIDPVNGRKHSDQPNFREVVR